MDLDFPLGFSVGDVTSVGDMFWCGQDSELWMELGCELESRAVFGLQGICELL
jgi:hypothetical protein